jgi:hypothetical protein
MWMRDAEPQAAEAAGLPDAGRHCRCPQAALTAHPVFGSNKNGAHKKSDELDKARPGCE